MAWSQVGGALLLLLLAAPTPSPLSHVCLPNALSQENDTATHMLHPPTLRAWLVRVSALATPHLASSPSELTSIAPLYTSVPAAARRVCCRCCPGRISSQGHGQQAVCHAPDSHHQHTGRGRGLLLAKALHLSCTHWCGGPHDSVLELLQEGGTAACQGGCAGGVGGGTHTNWTC